MTCDVGLSHHVMTCVRLCGYVASRVGLSRSVAAYSGSMSGDVVVGRIRLCLFGGLPNVVVLFVSRHLV